MITLIGKELAREGVSFIFHEPAEECESCRFKSSCVDSLEEGHRYTIVGDNGLTREAAIKLAKKTEVI